MAVLRLLARGVVISYILAKDGRVTAIRAKRRVMAVLHLLAKGVVISHILAKDWRVMAILQSPAIGSVIFADLTISIVGEALTI